MFHIPYRSRKPGQDALIVLRIYLYMYRCQSVPSVIRQELTIAVVVVIVVKEEEEEEDARLFYSIKSDK